jgi:hypothetical protein
MEGRPLALTPIGQGAYRTRANTVGNTSNIWEVNVNELVKNLKPGNANTIGRKAANISWANKPLKKSTLPPLPPSPNGNKARKTRKTRKARRTRKQRK